MKKVEASFPWLNTTERQILQFLFENNQANLSSLVDALAKSEQAIRNGLNKLSLLWIIEKNTGKIRDKNAPYVFKKT
jgi:ATP-dependent DNA helicase RecG